MSHATTGELPDFESIPETEDIPVQDRPALAIVVSLLSASVALAAEYDEARPSHDRIKAAESEVVDVALAYGRAVRAEAVK